MKSAEALRPGLHQILLYALDVTNFLSAAKYGLGQHLPAVLPTVVPFQKVGIIVMQISISLH